MPFNGNGTFVLPGPPLEPGEIVSADEHNELRDDMATGFTDCVTRDGQSPAVANLPMGTYKHTNVGASNSLTNYARTDQVQNSSFNWLTSVSGSNTITAASAVAPAAYAAGQRFAFIPSAVNTDPVTININSLGAKSIKLNGQDDLYAGFLNPGTVYTIVYDGTNFQVALANNSGVFYVERFSGDGSETEFTLTRSAINKNYLLVYIYGVYQQKDTYSFSGTTLTFDTAPPLGTDNIEVVISSTLAIGETDASAVSYTLPATGAVTTNVEAKLAQTVSVKDFGAVGDGVTDDTAAIQDAVNYCYAEGSQLDWPVGIYLTTLSIANLHSVFHTGTGSIKRDGNTFYVNPQRSNTNTFYVSTTGVSTNDGLSVNQPMTTQAACNALQVYGPVLEGNWQISLAAGTYNRQTLILPTATYSRNNIIIFGPPTGDFRSVPTVVLDGQNQSGTCIASSLNNRIKIKDVKIVNWCDGTPDYRNGAFAGVGVDISNTLATVENVHIDSCDCGFYAKSQANYTYKGGIIENCGAGVQELFGVIRDFKIAGSTANRTTFENCTYGLKAKELCTGHLDFIECLDNTYGVYFTRNCTANLTGSIFKRNNVGVYTQAGSSFVDLTVTWGTGADANNVKFSTDNSSTEIIRKGGENLQSRLFVGKGSKLIGNVVTNVNHTGTTSDTKVAQFNETEIGDFQAIGEYYEGLAYGTANLSSTATLRFRVGGNGASVITMPTGSYNWSFKWRFTSQGTSNTQVAYGEFNYDSGSPIIVVNKRNYSFATTPFLLGLYVQLSNASDSVDVSGSHLYTSEM